MYVGGVPKFVKMTNFAPKTSAEVLNLQVYRIAGLGFGIEGADGTEEDGIWRKFSSDGDVQVIFRVRYVKALPKFDVPAYFSDGRLRRYRTKGGEARVYSDLFTHRDTVAVTEHTQGDRLVQELAISADRSPWGASAGQLFEVLDLPRLLFGFGRLAMHGAYIELQGRAIVFTAPSGVGKSTQAELWRKHCGARIVNGDRAVLGFEGGCLTAYGFPFSGSSSDCENVTAPIAAIVSLSQAKENRLEALRGKDAIRHLLRGVYSEGGNDFAGQIMLALRAAQSVPIYHLACLPDESAVEILHRELQKNRNVL